MPACRQRPGLGLAIADDATDQQLGIVERSAVGVCESVTELATLVNGAWHLGCHVATDASREREQTKQPVHSLRILRDIRIDLAPRAFEPGVGHGRGTAMPGAHDDDGVLIPRSNYAIHVG